MFQIFSFELPIWRAEIRTRYDKPTPIRVFHARREGYKVDSQDKIWLNEHEMLNEQINEAHILLAREYARGEPVATWLEQRPHPFMDVGEGNARPLGKLAIHDWVLNATLYVGASIFDELWTRHTVGGAMPKHLRFTVEGFEEQPGGRLLWQTDKHRELPITTLDLQIFAVDHSAKQGP